jgi:hypothetical protein
MVCVVLSLGFCETKHFFDTFPIHYILKEGDALLSLLFNFAVECDISKV